MVPVFRGHLPAKKGHVTYFCPTELKQTSFGWASGSIYQDRKDLYFETSVKTKDSHTHLFFVY